MSKYAYLKNHCSQRNKDNLFGVHLERYQLFQAVECIQGREANPDLYKYCMAIEQQGVYDRFLLSKNLLVKISQWDRPVISFFDLTG